MDDTLFDSQNAAYAQAMFERFARNPESVPDAWRSIFRNGGTRAVAEGLFVPDQLDGHRGVVAPAVAPAVTPAPAPEPGQSLAEHLEAVGRLQKALPVVSRAAALVQAFRDHGHQLARIDPLGSEPPGHPQLNPSFFGTSIEELAELPSSLVMNDGRERSVADALHELVEVYAGSTGYEFEHVNDHVKVAWLWEQVEEGRYFPMMSVENRCRLLRRLTEVEGLEQFLHRAYLGQKRFSIEGMDVLVPMLDLAMQDALRDGAREVVIGMAHRGRLNVLTHIVGVSYAELLSEFEGPPYQESQLHVHGTGDVKYHHGARGERTFADLGAIEVTLAPNPSHLEFVNPVVAGMARARQFQGTSRDDGQDTSRVVPVTIHGDAAFAAEGIVAETLNMARLAGFDVGGTVHIIENNQIGFTTDPRDGRSTFYASDLAKGYGIPVVHVNADEPEACLAATRLAMAYRDHFGEDFVIDLVGYRRHGHNEGDEPAYTQPVLYHAIAEHPTVRALYAQRLIAEGVVTEQEAEAMQAEVAQTLRDAQDNVREHEPEEAAEPADDRETAFEPTTTGVAFEQLSRISQLIVTLPEGFKPHPKLWRQFERRSRDFAPDRPVDWGLAEALAFGSLLEEGIPIRLTGQDTQRGTFSHRHAVLHDEDTGGETVPLRQVADTRFEVHNSPLTETAVLGFEYGYSVGADADVVLWEAQFGDFGNVAQVIVDQFLSSGRTKWEQYSRLTLLLPHGYEGQGPEHSSARLERFLQLCAEDNLRVVYPTTPAQYFHLLRRQAHMRPARPMVVMTPKSLLRLPAAASPVSELVEGRFQPVIADPGLEDPARVERMVLCSGKVYYDILAHERRAEAATTAVCRIEQLYPFPADEIRAAAARYPELKEVVWTQEEPRNMGALTWVGPRLRGVIPRKVSLTYVARPERASPAEGKAKEHARQQERLVLDALGLEAAEAKS